MEITGNTVSILFHNYYNDFPKWKHRFRLIPSFHARILVNTVIDSIHNADEGYNLYHNDHEETFCQTFSPNKGKDIGGKLILIDSYLKQACKSEFILLLHDKRSPYHTKGKEWSETLLSIATETFVSSAISEFRTNPQVGIVANKFSILNELDNSEGSRFYIDSIVIKELKKEYAIHPSDLRYVAGCMFWVRSSIFEDFFKEYHPLKIRKTLEQGNVTDEDGPKNTHAWERLFSWLVTSRGYKIKGI